MKHIITQVRHGFEDPVLGHGWSNVYHCTCGWKTTYKDNSVEQMIQKRNHCNENDC